MATYNAIKYNVDFGGHSGHLIPIASTTFSNSSSVEFTSIKQNSEGYYILGNIQKKLKKLNDAIISFENAIKLNSNFFF